MKKSRFAGSQKIQPLKEHEAGKNVLDICREPQINRNSFCNWKKKYTGVNEELLRKFKQLERENAKFKRMYTDLSLDHRILKNVIEKKL